MRANEACKPIDSPDAPKLPPGESGELGEFFVNPRKLCVRCPFYTGGMPGGMFAGGGEQSGVCVHHCACVFAGAFFSRFWGSKTLRRVSVRLASKRPQKGPFLGLIGWRIDGRSRAWGDVLSPRRKASAQDAPVRPRARIRSYQVPDATSAVSSVPSRTHRQVTRKHYRTKPRQIRRPSPRCGAS